MNKPRHHTPLRYPGGKQKLAPFIREILEVNDLVGGDYVEPYAGGAGVAIDLLLTEQVKRIHLNDSSRAVHSFWYSVLHYTEDFCRRVIDRPLSVAEWRRQRDILRTPDEFNAIDLGFSLFYLNRCNRSGIPSGGLIGGLQQRGEWRMNARFPRRELVRRIEAIAARKAAIKLKNWDAERFIEDYVPRLPPSSLVYCDPPYFGQGHRLYLSKYKPTDHKRIARVVQNNLQRPWVVSYDNAPEILGFYSDRKSFLYDLQYNAQRVHLGKEVFVFSDTLQLPDRSAVRSINNVMLAAA